MKIKITKKSDDKNAGWYNNYVGREFEAASYPYSFCGLIQISVFVDSNIQDSVNFDRDRDFFLNRINNNWVVKKGDYEFVKEQENERN